MGEGCRNKTKEHTTAPGKNIKLHRCLVGYGGLIIRQGDKKMNPKDLNPNTRASRNVLGLGNTDTLPGQRWVKVIYKSVNSCHTKHNNGKDHENTCTDKFFFKKNNNKKVDFECHV